MEYIKARRSNYALEGECPLSDVEMQQLVLDAIKHTPSMFNMQSTRAVILFGEAHVRFWKLVEESLGPEILAKRPNVAYQLYDKVQLKIDSLTRGRGTVLFFEDPKVREETAQRYPAYSKNFGTWALQSSAMAQQNVWLAVTEASPEIGITLQHYYPDRERLSTEWHIPRDWEMTGQMPFGRAAKPPFEKDFRPDAELLRVFE